jgi:hypothetical protein
MTKNVIAFAPWRATPLDPPLEFTELRLGQDFSLQMTLFDPERNLVAVLEWSGPPRLVRSGPLRLALHIVLDMLHSAWERWRDSSGIAS